MKQITSVFYRPIDGSAPLSIYYYESGNLGDAIEANNEIGVGWFSPNGELLAVQFDDVNEKEDHQILEFDRHQIEVWVSNGKIKHSVSTVGKNKKVTRPSKKKTEDAA